MKSQAKQMMHAVLCYALSLLVGLSMMASPLFVSLVLAQRATADETAAAETTGDETSGDDVDVDDEPEGVTPTKLSLAAYPLADDGETWDTSAKKTKSITENGGELRILAVVTWSDGVVYSEEDLEWGERGGFTTGFTYTSEDPEKLTVGPTGIVRALGNGSTKVTVSANNESYDLSASITITTSNQGKDLIVTKLQIVNENNKPYKSKPVKLTQSNNTAKIYARVTYRNLPAEKEQKAWKKEVAAQQEAVKELKETLSKLKAQLETRNDELAEFEKELSAQKKALEKAQSEYDDAAAALEDLEKQLEELDEEATEEEVAALEEQIAEAKKAEAAAKKALTKAEDAVESAQSDVDTKEQQISTLESQISKQESEIAKAEAAIDTSKTFRTKVIYSNAPGAPKSEQPQDGDPYSTVEEAFSTLRWQAGDSQYVSVTAHKGVATLKAVADAVTRVYATINGGDDSVNTGFGYGVVYGEVKVNVNNGKTIDGKTAADKLHVKVVYEQDLDNVAVEKTYSISKFKKLGVITRTYTLTQKAGKYVTDRAQGVPLASILRDLKVDADDISYFRLAANDGVNPGKLSAKFLVKTTRYYLPNYDLGGSWQEKEQVPTMIALKDSWNENTQVTGEMNSGTRFRLVFGSASSADQATDKSIKYINTMTIVLNGGAPVSDGDDDDNKQQRPEPPQGGNSNGTGGNNGNTTSNTSGTTGGPQSSYTAAPTQATGVGDQPGDDSEEASVPWRIFEMMNKSLSDLVVQYADNPFLPFLIPFLGLIIVLSATGRFVRFRRLLA